MQKNIIYCVLFCFGSITFSWAQLSPKEGANQAVTIGVSPVFSFAGNLFSAAGRNDLSFSGSSAMYRKVYAENRAWRIGGWINLDQSVYPLPIGRVTGRTDKRRGLQVSLYAGKEYFSLISLKNDRAWRFFVGWQGGLGARSFKAEYKYFDEQGSGSPARTQQRILESNRLRAVSALFHGIAGVEYYFSKHFFVGTRLNIGGFVAYELENKEEFVTVNFDDQNGVVDSSAPFTIRSGGGMELGFDNTNVLVFSAGFAF
ncbi:MAG: hypothetical protein ACJAZH_001299 [Roseivirga sp.]|jgi:hypothetical protein